MSSLRGDFIGFPNGPVFDILNSNHCLHLMAYVTVFQSNAAI